MADKYNYLTEYFTYEGKRYKVYGKTEAELKKKIKAKMEKVMEQSRSTIFDSITTMDIWAEKAFDTYRSGSSNYKAMKSRYARYVSPYIGHIPISKITPIQCQEIINKSTEMSYSHCDKLRQELKFLFDTAIDNGLTEKNPASRVVLPKVQKGTHRSITDEERACLYKVYEKNGKFLPFIIMLECGCRSKEVIQLLGSDIDQDNKLLHIRGTKSDNADRYVRIPDKLFETLRNTPETSYIALNEFGRHYTKQGFYRLVQRLYREMNIEMGCKVYRNQLVPPYPLAEDFEPYCLRHTFCTDLAKANVDIRTAQKLMGHANISITAEIYTHVDQSQILDAGEKMNEYLKSILK